MKIQKSNLNLKSLFLIAMVVCCAGMFVVNTGIAQAETIIVQPGEAIQVAIDNLPAEGGVVELASGVHDVYDTIVIDKSNITIQGTHDSVITTHDSSKDIFAIPHENPSPDEPWDTMPVLKNFSFKGFKVSSSYGYVWGTYEALINAWNVNNLTVENVIDDSWLRYLVNLNPTGGYTTARSKDIFIRNNTIYNSGIVTGFSENINVLDNFLQGSLAILHFDRNNKHIHVINNHINTSGGSYACIVMDISQYYEIRDNVIIGNRHGLRIAAGPDHIIVDNNTITGSTRSGIFFDELYGMEDATVSNNRIYNNKVGIDTSYHSWIPEEDITQGFANITNNIIYSNTEDGIRMGTRCVTLNISNNIITNNGGYGIDYMETREPSIIKYNDIYGNVLGDYDGTSAGTGDISTDPFFADSANGDFHLKSTAGRWTENGWVIDAETSPCIDAGDPVDDYSNESEPNGGRINMGAYGNTDEASKSSGDGCYTYKLVNPGESIQEAIDGLCDSGGTIDLASGIHEITDELYPPGTFITFYEDRPVDYSIIINKSNVTIQGTHESIIRHHNPDVHCFFIPDLENIDPDLYVENTIFRGFKVSDAYGGARGAHTISAMHVRDFTVENIYSDAYVHTFAVVGSWQGHFRYSENIYYKDNTIIKGGLSILFAYNIHWIDNTINSGCIDVNRNNKYVYIHGNYVSNPPNFCLRGHGGNDVHVYDNVFVGGQAGIYSDGLSHAEIYNNTIIGSSIAGIYLNPQGQITDQTFRNNIIYNCTRGVFTSHFSYGFSEKVSDADIINNIIYNCAGDGIQMTSEYVQLYIRNNIITNNGGYGINYIDTINPTTINYNDIWNNSSGNYNNTSAGTGDISSDPLFASTTSGSEDFHLKSQFGRWNGSTWVNDSQTSPCIDAGDPLSDYSNEPSSNGDRINMGAYGNTVYASKSSGGTPPPPPDGLVGHWKFDENSGDIAIDSSGNNNNGTLTNMDTSSAWVEGKIGGALEFDGSNDYVDIPIPASWYGENINSLTIEMWVKPTDDTTIAPFGTCCTNRLYISRQSSDDWRLGIANKGVASTGQPIDENSWQHLALVMDNGTASLYKNGNIPSLTTSYSTYTPGNKPLIGFDRDYRFAGVIDEVRIYNTALTAEEVLAHYQEGNQPQENHLPIGNLDTADQSQITGWAYDLNAGTNPIDVHIYIDRINVGSAVANESRPDLVEAGVCPDPNHGFTFSTPSLSIGEHTVNVYAINYPEGTNPELIGSPMTFNVTSSDTTPPTGSIQINSGDAKTNSQNVNLSISASDPSGLSEMKISETNDFSSVAAEAYNTIKNFLLSTGDGIKTVYIWFKDTIGNWNTSPYSDTIILDSTSPVISNISVSNITANTAIINFQTNEDSYSHIEYGTSVAYGFQLPANSELKTDYSISITGLGSNTEYHFRVVSKDELENQSNSTDQTFKTIGNPDTTPPSKITDLSSSNITQTSADLLWTSKGDDGNNGTSASYDIRYSRQNPSDLSGQALQSWWEQATQLTGEPIPSSSGTEEYVSVGLSSNTTYYFIIKSGDEVPNWSDYSNILSFKTLEQTGGGGGGTVSDTTPPSQPSNFKAIPADSQITLNWKNPNDLDFVRVVILRKENSAPTCHNDSSAVVIYEGTNEQYADIELNNNATYYYSIFAYDKRPNYSKILSLSSKPEKGKTSIEISNETYPELTLLKSPDSFKIYIIINQKKKWIPTPEVFETLGYQWTSITIIDKNQLTLIPDYEDNLIRALNDYKVYLIVQGIKRHIPNPEIFLNYGFDWNEVKDVNQETINQYTQANLIKESKKEEIYYLCPTRKIKRWLRSPEIFNSYPDNNWNNIQVISKYEMDHYPESNLIQLIGDNNVYLIENNRKRLINSVEEFEKEGLDWGKVMGVGEVEFEWFE